MKNKEEKNKGDRNAVNRQLWRAFNLIKTEPESLIDKPMIRNSLICKLINVQASMKENNEKKIKNEDEISKLIKAFPKDIAALDKRSVLAKVNSQGSGTQKPSPGQIPKLGEDNE